MFQGQVFTEATMAEMLGFPRKNDHIPPPAGKDEIVLYYGSWSVRGLSVCPAVEKMLPTVNPKQDRYNEVAPPGFYRLKQHLFNGTWENQVARLASVDASASAAPLAVAVTAVLLCLLTGDNPLEGFAVRCQEGPANGKGRYCLGVWNNTLCIGNDTPDWHQAPSLGLVAAVHFPV